MSVITNACINPSGEVDTTGWTVSVNGSIAVDAGYAAVGTNSIMYTCGSTAIAVGMATDTGNRPAASSGQVWYLKAKVQSSASSRLVRMAVAWKDGLDGTGATLFQVESDGVALTAATPADLTFTTTAPAGTASFILFFQEISGNIQAGDTLHFDAILFSTADADYFDGDTTDGGGYIYDWTGTPNASTSTRTDAPVGGLGNGILRIPPITIRIR